MKIAILSPRKGALTETFISAHIELLDGNKIVYHSGRLPKMKDDERLTAANHIAVRAARKIQSALFSGNTLLLQEKAFLKSLLREKPDVILAEYGTTAAYNIHLIEKSGIPLVIHFHGFDASEKPILEEYAARYKQMFAYATAIVAVSSVMKQMLIDLGAPKEKIVQTCYGPNESYLGIHSSFDKKKFLAIGRMVDKKAPHLLVLAFQKVIATHPDATLTIIGDGPLFRITSELVTNLGLEKNIHLKGAQGAAFIQNEMKDSIAFVQHSRTAENGDMEGTPVAVLEAQAAALPVISTIHAGIPDVVVHGKTGFLVSEGDVNAMSKHMIDIANDYENARQMGRAGRQRIQEHFTMKHHIDTLNEVIKKSIR
jgi:glycosyltransferase involved in cell wall biosynthesis